MFGSRNFLFARIAAVAGDKLFSWGGNDSGQLGLANTTNYSSPKQVGTLVGWETPSAGRRTNIFVKTDGTLWSWGQNNYGKLGDGTTTNRSSPVQVGALTNWSKPSAGSQNSACIRTDGTLWTWGEGFYGANGQGNTTNRSSPVQIGSSTTWTEISCGNKFALAVDNGKLFAWGRNGDGQLGLNNTTQLSSPVQVGALTTWAKPTTSKDGSYPFSICTKTDGTIWSWGRNYYMGALGLGNTTNYSSPKQIGSLTDWSIPVAGNNHVLCVKTNGTLWSWGRSNYGALGLGAVSARSSPSQIGALTSWVTPAAGNNFSFCIKNDGTLWAWGLNQNYGQLGINNLTNKNSPVQVGSLTTWVKVAGGINHATATQT
jgi:alpha-tubulin suppressor-like RCC1 family protein